MKHFMLFFFLLLGTLFSYAESEDITIDFGSTIIITKYHVVRGDKKLTLIPEVGTVITVTITKNYNVYPTFQISQPDAAVAGEITLPKNSKTLDLSFGDNTIYELDVIVTNATDKTEIKTY